MIAYPRDGKCIETASCATVICCGKPLSCYDLSDEVSLAWDVRNKHMLYSSICDQACKS